MATLQSLYYLLYESESIRPADVVETLSVIQGRRRDGHFHDTIPTL